MKKLFICILLAMPLFNVAYANNFDVNYQMVQETSDGWESLGQVEVYYDLGTDNPTHMYLMLYVKVIQGQTFYQVRDKYGNKWSVTKNPYYNKGTYWRQRYTHVAGNYYFNLTYDD